MSIEWLDHRILLTCNILVALLFSILLFGVGWTYPRMRGTLYAATAFIVSVPGGILMATQTTATFRLPVVFADASVLLFYFFTYLAITEVLSVPGFPRLVWTITILPIASIAFFTYVDDKIIGRMVSLGFSVGMLRLFIGITLHRHHAKRRLLRAFAFFMLFSAIVALGFTAKMALHGNPADFYQGGHVAVKNLIFSLICFSLTGVFFVAVFADELTEVVSRRAQVDPLTGILNRQGITVRFAAELGRATRGHHPLSILLIDIDYFKSINDTLGHRAGDEALTHVTQSIQGEMRSHDLFGRFGGDEFLVLLPETDAVQAVEIAERICRAPSRTRPITLSIGLAEANATDRLSTLIDRADAALYDAKRDGRACVRTNLLTPEPILPERIPTLH